MPVSQEAAHVEVSFGDGTEETMEQTSVDIRSIPHEKEQKVQSPIYCVK